MKKNVKIAEISVFSIQKYPDSIFRRLAGDAGLTRLLPAAKKPVRSGKKNL